MNRTKISMLLLLILLMSIFIVSSVYAGDVDRIGTASGTQLQIPVGARDIALGGSTVARTRGVEAIYWNPAGLSLMENNASVLFTTMNHLYDIRVNYFALGAKVGSLGHIGVSFKSVSFGDISLTTTEDMDGTTGKTFSPTFATIGLTFSRRLTDAIQIGVNAKLLYESIPRASAGAFAFDVGIQYHQVGGITGLALGLMVSNIGSNMTYSGSAMLSNYYDETGRKTFYDRPVASSQLPASVEIGLSYDYTMRETDKLSLSSMFQNNNFENDAVKTGVEYLYNNFIAARLGYIYTVDASSDDRIYDLTLGAGIQYEVGSSNIVLDYTFRNCKYFDANHIFSLKVEF